MPAWRTVDSKFVRVQWTKQCDCSDGDCDPSVFKGPQYPAPKCPKCGAVYAFEGVSVYTRSEDGPARVAMRTVTRLSERLTDEIFKLAVDD